MAVPSAAARMRAHRQRQAAGKIPLHIEVSEVDDVEFLIEAKCLQEADREDRNKIARGVEKLLAKLSLLHRNGVTLGGVQ